MSEISHLRQLRKEKRIQLLAMASTSNIIKSTKTSSKPGKDFVVSFLIQLFISFRIHFYRIFLIFIVLYTVPQKKMSNEQMRERLRKRYLRLNEVRYKRLQREKQEEARRNKLMAKIFCKKLQQKVLRGQVDLSQSVSVISNL